MNRAVPGPDSRKLFQRAQRILVGGVDSPVRSFGAVGGTPVFFASGKGAYLYDVDGNRYVDFLGSWGASILGHAPPAVVRSVIAATRRGVSFGAPSPLEHELGERIHRCVPEVELLRFVSSGTEAVMSAIRVARGYTGRSKIVKFAGGYHGHSDGLLARAGSGVTTQVLPDSAGVPATIVAETLVAPFNDLEAIRTMFERNPEEIAAVVVEPVPGNMGVVPPVRGFLSGLDRIVHEFGSLLIADEVITGFRLRRGIIHPTYDCKADLVTLGKIIGGGLNIGAYGGRRGVMEQVAPLGPVYQAGTLAGNPLAMAAGIATLDELTPSVYRELERRSSQLETILLETMEQERAEPFQIHRAGSMLGLFFTAQEVRDYETALTSDRKRYAAFFHSTLNDRIYLPPSPWETLFVSAATSQRDVELQIPAFARAFRASRRRSDAD